MQATAKGVKISTRKVRLVADAIRNQSVVDALKILTLTPKHGAYALEKVLKSAVANSKMREDQLLISELTVNEGQFLKRFHASTRGRIHGYKKRTTHITVVLKEKEVKVAPVQKTEKVEEPEVAAKKTEVKKEEK